MERRLSLYVREEASSGPFRFNACFPADAVGLARVTNEAKWYNRRGYVTIVFETNGDTSKYNPPIVTGPWP